MSDAFWAVMPAAGAGSRMASDVPKQYLSLAGRFVIDHAIERLLLHPMIDGLYLALADGDRLWPRSEFHGHPDIVTVPGGSQRGDSVLSALDALTGCAADDDWVLVHDAARPLVRRDDITHLIEQLRHHPVGGLLGAPVSDTIKCSDAAGVVTATPRRDLLWRALTPQMFRLGALRDAWRAVLVAGQPCTDEASAMEHLGVSPQMVPGHTDNLKITFPSDLALAGFYLQQQQLADH